jgi:hypothetical protein
MTGLGCVGAFDDAHAHLAGHGHQLLFLIGCHEVLLFVRYLSGGRGRHISGTYFNIYHYKTNRSKAQGDLLESSRLPSRSASPFVRTNIMPKGDRNAKKMPDSANLAPKFVDILNRLCYTDKAYK